MADHAHEVGLISFFIKGIAYGLSVYGQALILLAIGVVPALKGSIQVQGIKADQDIANDGETGNEIATIFTATVETLSDFVSQALRPIRVGLTSPHSTQDCSGGDGQNRGKGISPSFSAAGIGGTRPC